MEKTYFSDELFKKLYPIYNKLFDENQLKNICTFCVQWGKNFPQKENTGILFVGKAVNGWITNETSVDKLFSYSNDEKIFNRLDQMTWVENLSGNNKGYNTRKSAFWRVVKKVSINFYYQDWHSNIAWSNLYKIAPWSGGNPNKGLRNIQTLYCQDLLKKEIEVLSPKFVVMLTSGWENFFLKYLTNNIKIKELESIVWSGYVTKLYKIDNVYYITSFHPQGKNEYEHVKAICDLIKKYN